MSNSALQLSEHALRRVSERGLTQDWIFELWNGGRFVQCFLARGEQHYVAFIPEIRDYFLLVQSTNGTVITVMPLIWRDRTVSDQCKLEAYRRACEGTVQQTSTATKPPGSSDTPLVVARGMLKNSRRWVRVGAWPRSTPLPETMRLLGKAIEVSMAEYVFVGLFHSRECVAKFDMDQC